MIFTVILSLLLGFILGFFARTYLEVKYNGK